MFYAITDEAGMYLHSGFNAMSEKEAKNDILSLIQPETESKDYNAMRKMPLSEILKIKGWGLDKSETRFPDAFEII